MTNDEVIRLATRLLDRELTPEEAFAFEKVAAVASSEAYASGFEVIQAMTRLSPAPVLDGPSTWDGEVGRIDGSEIPAGDPDRKFIGDDSFLETVVLDAGAEPIGPVTTSIVYDHDYSDED